MQKLDNEELKNVSGGYILDRNLEPGGIEYEYRWAVVDNEGYICQCFSKKEYCYSECRAEKTPTTEITWEEYLKLIENRKK